jgi:integrase/recombinase XerD
VIHIRQAKGRKDRYVMLSEQLLIIFRDYWRRTHPSHWLFPGPDQSRPVTTRSVQRAFRNAADAAGTAASHPDELINRRRFCLSKSFLSFVLH